MTNTPNPQAKNNSEVEPLILKVCPINIKAAPKIKALRINNASPIDRLPS
jgi:hypothetical protein